MNMPNVTVLRPAMTFYEVVKVHGWCFPSKDVSHTIYYARKGSRWAINRLNGVNEDGSPSKFRQNHYEKWRFLADSPFKISDKCCDVMKLAPLKKYQRLSGKFAIVGTMAAESRRRKQGWIQSGCNNFDSKTPTSKPLSIWTEANILEYIRDYNIPIASVYGDIVEDKKGRFELSSSHISQSFQRRK